jgi:hypothetical protein
VTQLGEQTRCAFEVAGAEVVEHQAVLVEMTRGELLLDRGLAFEQPVHRLAPERTTNQVEDMSTTPLAVGKPAQYVVEVNAGWARRHGIAEGTRARLESVALRL